MKQQFNDRWQRDYLHTLQVRNKWKRPQKNLEVNDLVFVRDESLPLGQWLVGRITEVYPGKDGLVRNVRITTKRWQS